MFCKARINTLKIYALVFMMAFFSFLYAKVEILNVSYDPTRELYKEINETFVDGWKQQTGQTVFIRQSHGGAGKQARAVIDGLEADVVTLALAYDIDAMHSIANLLPANWQSRLPHNSCPYTSTIIFLVRKGNPKNIRDWDDLIKPGVQVITPNPKTSGGARWNYLAAWGFALRKWGDSDDKARQFVTQLFKNVPVLDTGARAATNTFIKGMGDVFLSWENEALLAINKLGHDQFEIVVPSVSILAEPPVALVEKNVDKHGTRQVAEAYLAFLYTEKGQDICARHYYRPQDAAVAAKYQNQFPQVTMFTIEDYFGGWQVAQQKHFGSGGIFDQIYTGK
ncbi:sulfate ABC transporter substrate-binding protein [candidate division KSB1 bacterium]|nr:sulfate ABC transporter substrate-binding protein [candidate division KSB1 bacterium]RQW06277.1 MAG: sulfate ABC transporter substrate-binding protein [candidate division KSB1 bacterium]